MVHVFGWILGSIFTVIGGQNELQRIMLSQEGLRGFYTVNEQKRKNEGLGV